LDNKQAKKPPCPVIFYIQSWNHYSPSSLKYFLMPGQRLRKPEWLKLRMRTGPEFGDIQRLLSETSLNTVCRSAMCPNLQECWSRGTATFLLLGNVCTRSCRFCAIGTQQKPIPPDPKEPARIAGAVTAMKLNFVVLTSVNRDDLPDGGARHWTETMKAIRLSSPDAGLECLIPDFEGNDEALDMVMNERPDVLNHNIETVPRLYTNVRPEASYNQSLSILDRALTLHGLATKSGMMVGMGETFEEVVASMKDLREAGCSRLTIGQYLQPTASHFPVERYVPPEEFDAYRDEALGMGFSTVQSGPFVRSSYLAGSEE